LQPKRYDIVVLDHEENVDSIGAEGATRSVDAPCAWRARASAATAVVGVAIDVDAIRAAHRLADAVSSRAHFATKTGVLIDPAVAVFVDGASVAALSARHAPVNQTCVGRPRDSAIDERVRHRDFPGLEAAQTRQHPHHQHAATHPSHVTRSIQYVHATPSPFAPLPVAAGLLQRLVEDVTQGAHATSTHHP
jgi:hypothetical protein